LSYVTLEVQQLCCRMCHWKFNNQQLICLMCHWKFNN
jgi:hypothetical protein